MLKEIKSIGVLRKRNTKDTAGHPDVSKASPLASNWLALCGGLSQPIDGMANLRVPCIITALDEKKGAA